MNKYQEALEYLTEEAYSNYFRKYVQTSKEKVTLFKSSKYLQELVDRATPKKPKEQLIDNYCKGIPGETPSEKELNYFCSNCNELVGNEWFKYNFCPNCGQAIDWGKR